MIMKKNLTLLLTLTLGINSYAQISDNDKKTASSIEISHLKENLYKIASDEFEGRKTGEKGQKLAAQFIRDYYKKIGIPSLKGTEDYFQPIPGEFMKRLFSPKLNDSENVIAYLEGSEFPNEYIVVSSHYDHVGMANGEIYNGADDNASGTTGVMELALLFKKEKDKGNGPKRSIIFLHCTGEEFGLHGSRYFTSNPLVPLENIKANINVDMIGRIDAKYKDNGNYIYVVGSLEEGKHLYEYMEESNNDFTKMKIDYTYDDRKHPEMIFYRSDHYNFAKNDIPVLFFHSGEHEDYHKPTDTADKISFDWMRKRIQLIYLTTLRAANE